MYTLEKPVLIVEDVRSIRKLLTKFMEQLGIETMECADGVEALQLWKKYRHDIVFMDFEIPGLHGLDVIAQIKHIDPNVYIIAATATYEPESFKRSIALGVDNWLAKPISQSSIRPIIVKAIQVCKLRQNEQLMRSAFESSASAQIILNSIGNIEYANQTFLNMVELDRDSVLNKDPNIFIKKASSPVPTNIDTKEAVIVSASGQHINALVSTGPEDEDSRCKPISIVDITMLKRREIEIRRLATTDSLTGLPNRTVMEDRIQQAAIKSDRDSKSMSVMFIDLDKFKSINDTYGHDVGDNLLIEFGKRIRKVLRNSDTLSRFGGDEFVILLPEVSSIEGAMLVAQKIIKALTEPFKIAGHDMNISSSIGVAVYPDLVKDAHELVRTSDEAMYKSKHNGRGCATLIGSTD